MERGDRFSRRRVKLIGSLVLLSTGLLFVPSALSEKVKLVWAGLLSPVESLADSVKRLVTRTAPDPGLVAEVEFMKKQLARAALEKKQLQSELGSLRALEEFDYEKRFDVIFADVVVPADASPWRSSMVIAKGSLHGVKPGQIVVYQQYLVGRVHQAGPFSARVVLETDAAFKVGAVTVPLDGGRDSSRQVGVAQGSGASKLVLRWISDFDALRQGQFVVTTADPAAGIPKGLMLGRILSLDRTQGPYPDIVIEPALQTRALDYVMVLSPKETR